MDITKNEISNFAKSLGMSKCGFAGVDRFAQSPKGNHPCDILPGCKSVIVIGSNLLDGVVQANFRAFEDGRQDLKGIYGTYGYTMLPNFELTYSCYAIAKFIESNTGALATPCSTGPMTNGMQISIRHAAVAAGLGEFGYMSIVLTPEYGPRIRFGVILTTLELEQSPMYNGPRLCNPEKCGICAMVCPTGAIRACGTHELDHIEMGDKKYDYTHVDVPKCRKALQSMTKQLGGAEDYLPTENPTIEQLFEAEAQMPIGGRGLQHIDSWNCGRCQMYCPVGDWSARYKQRGLSRGPKFAFGDEDKH
ncbi:MAG: 4Fe-4S binding protein [Oscillospiraceae bacterium]|nr:4Fe-4S binding protein [Oscillospiraceae bacterium]